MEGKMYRDENIPARKRVLLVDDEVGYTDLVRINLEDTEEYEVCCENDPERAVNTALRFHPDIVFMDIVMPGKDGGDVAFSFKQNPELKSIPLVIVTALLDSRETNGEVIVNEDGQQMIGKPVRTSTLCDCITQNVY
jgi:CheY-like chemotaxis protein